MYNKNRKLHNVLGGTLLALLPGLGSASPPSDAAVGQIDAILDYCVKEEPRLSAGAHTDRALFTGHGAEAKRSSHEYHQAYEQVSTALAKGNRTREIAACATGLAPKHHDHDDTRNDGHKKHP
jgi:hypothetical protein